MTQYHSLLLRQLKRIGLDGGARPPTANEWASFLERVNRAYVETDQERYLHERSHAIASREMQELYGRLEEAQRITGLGSWSFDVAKDAAAWSEECFRILGFDPAGPSPSFKEAMNRIDELSRAPFRDRIRAALVDGTDFQIEIRVLAPAGEMRWAEVLGHPVRGADGRVRRLHGTLMDISRRKEAEERILCLNAELEQRVRERTQQLEAAYAELEAFSYSVSHDLRAPLRAINGFASLLAEEYAGSPNAAALDCLGRIQRATLRMGNIIDDLLDLARVSRAEIQIEQTNVSHIAAAVMTELEIDSPQQRVETFVEQGIVVSADPRLLHILLENLLSNAWKYSRKRPDAKVSVGSRIDDGETVVFVRDNGVGFDMRHAEKLFSPFKRLHHEREFEGTGVGLATVQRIVERHGGRIWAEAAPDQGATFYFTLR